LLETNAQNLGRDLRAILGVQFDDSKDPMWIFDQVSLAFLAVNAAALRIYGYREEEFLGMTILDIRPHEDIPQVLRNALWPHKVSGRTEQWRHRTRSGRVMEVEIVGHPLIFEGHLAQLITVHLPGAGFSLVTSHARN
jgi:PAS domain S-box-containing protein